MPPEEKQPLLRPSPAPAGPSCMVCHTQSRRALPWNTSHLRAPGPAERTRAHAARRKSVRVSSVESRFPLRCSVDVCFRWCEPRRDASVRPRPPALCVCGLGSHICHTHVACMHSDPTLTVWQLALRLVHCEAEAPRPCAARLAARRHARPRPLRGPLLAGAPRDAYCIAPPAGDERGGCLRYFWDLSAFLFCRRAPCGA